MSKRPILDESLIDLEEKFSLDAKNCLTMLQLSRLNTPENIEKVKKIIFSPQAIFKLFCSMNLYHHDLGFDPPMLQFNFNIYVSRAYLCIVGAAVTLSGFSNKIQPFLAQDHAGMVAGYLPFNDVVNVALTSKTIYRSAKKISGGTLFEQWIGKTPVELPHVATAAILEFSNEFKPSLDGNVAGKIGSFLEFKDILSVAKTKKTTYQSTKLASGFNWSSTSVRLTHTAKNSESAVQPKL